MIPNPDVVPVLAHHPSAFIPGADRYLAVAAFLAGGLWAGLDWLNGWQEFVSVEIADNVVQAWPRALLAGSFSAEESTQLLNGQGSSELNSRAVALLFEKLEKFVNLSQTANEEMLAAFRRMHNGA